MSANAADHWSGVWHTAHQFGKPRLNLDKNGDRVEGSYSSKKGAIKGHIEGQLIGADNRVWKGTYRDTKGGDSHDKFRVKLLGDDVSFEGWFKGCGRGNFFCGDEIDWTGEHA